MLEIGGVLTGHMTTHIIAMNVIAPIAAAMARRLSPRRPSGSIGLATIVQIVLLWAWHIPAAIALAGISPAVMAAMHLSLFAAALWFWMCVMKEAEDSRWRTLSALLITGKLVCLLGVLLVFAPRPIYVEVLRMHGGAGHAMTAEAMLADQQFAGLLMLVACPFTYVLAGVVVAARWIRQIERSPAWTWPRATGLIRNPATGGQ